MTRILQIRRGTTAQNDNFTGLSGEITMDTTKKKIRIHDGETLGGFELARTDDIPTIDEVFDINSVSTEFWDNLFESYGSHAIQSASIDPVDLSTNINYIDCSFDNLSKMPLISRATLICKSDDSGYVTGDETDAFGIGDYAKPMIYTYISNNVVRTRLFIAKSQIWVPNKTNGVKTNITTSKWQVKISVYY